MALENDRKDRFALYENPMLGYENATDGMQRVGR